MKKHSSQRTTAHRTTAAAVFLALFLSMSFMAWAQDNKPYILPGKGHLNIENLGKSTQIDISQLSLSELRVLRNAFAARQGYIFENSDLRSLFMTTSWYYDKAVQRHNGKLKPIVYNAKETAFIERIQKREAELKSKNFKPTGGGLVNTDNIVNTYQLNSLDPKLLKALTKNGFAIVPTGEDQLFQIYERNMYEVFPSFITTDVYLQLFHLYFDTTMRKVEESTLLGAITDLSATLYQDMNKVARESKDADVVRAAKWNAAYFAIAQALATGKPMPAVDADYQDMAEQEVKAVNDAIDGFSTFLDYTEVKYAYSLFRPRGHYTRSEAAKRYFRAMMWLQNVNFGTDKYHQMLCAALIAEALDINAKAMTLYHRVYDPITFLMGEPDNVTLLQMGNEMRREGANTAKMSQDGELYQRIIDRVDKIGIQQTRIIPAFLRTSRVKLNLMPQRYQPDAEVLLKMVDYDNETSLRPLPMGLDVMAAMGARSAERLLIEELKEPARWDKFNTALEDMKKRMKEIDWSTSVATRWMNSLTAINTSQDNRYPYFMKTLQWDKKELNTTLASWAELKHDAILYAKQPFGAECGGGDVLPNPITPAFVEPYVEFWTKAVDLMNQIEKVLNQFQLMTPDVQELTNSIREQAKLLLTLSEKELAGTNFTATESEQIRVLGAIYENLSLKMLSEEDQMLTGWYEVSGADKSVAVIADVYTANADNNPNKSILFEGVGPANEIFVVMELKGLLYIMRGAVFSYREFDQALQGPRLTDEEWQEILKSNPDKGQPQWMNEIIAPLKEKPKGNSEIFYSSDC